MKWSSIFLFLVSGLLSCQSASQTDEPRSARTSEPSGLEEVRILARGME